MPRILLADNLSLPPAAVTESIFIGGRKGSGKTNTGQLLFEQMVGIGAQCVALDPVGNWYSLRLSASVKRAGLDIPIFGGEHGDIPITPKGGRLLAQTVVERGTSCVIDLMNLRKAQRKEFSRDFADELFELKKRKRTPLHLFVEEARLFAPQVFKGQVDVEMCDAFEQIVRLGRNYGLGVSLLDQRPQSVNKEVTSQTEILIVHQITERLGRKEMEDWVRAKSVAGGEALEQLAELGTGEAFVWSPGLLRKFARVKVHKKQTYDASKTPVLGVAEQVAPRPLSRTDLEALKTAMAGVVQEAEASDPRKLRARIVELERELAKAAVVKQVMVIDQAIVDHVLQLEDQVTRKLMEVTQLISQTANELAKRKSAPKTSVVGPAADRRSVQPPAAPVVRSTTDGPSKAEENILRSLAWLASIGLTRPKVEAVAFLAGYSPRGGYFNNTKGAMRTKGWVDYTRDGGIFLTDAGRVIAPRIERPMTIEEMHAAVLGICNKAQGQLLKPLLEVWPGALSNEELAARAGYDPQGGYFNNTRGSLRTLGLIDYPSKGLVRAEDFLFLGA